MSCSIDISPSQNISTDNNDFNYPLNYRLKPLSWYYEKHPKSLYMQDKIQDLNSEFNKLKLAKNCIYSNSKCKNFTDYLINAQFGRFFQKQFHDIKRTKLKKAAASRTAPISIESKSKTPIFIKNKSVSKSKNKKKPPNYKLRASFNSAKDISVKFDKANYGSSIGGTTSLFELTQPQKEFRSAIQDNSSDPDIFKKALKLPSNSTTQWSTTVFQSIHQNRESASPRYHSKLPSTTISQNALSTVKTAKKRIAFDMINSKLSLNKQDQPLFLNPIINIKQGRISSIVFKGQMSLK